ncbi:hypothetical protein Scep_021192 [Stephania cephalantha]|uniref:hAT-like transposase RNase-H fold domain-containing protein n=1 Tax=Stephania cephalantha TaxID=152367 RepID=A0AAP0FAC6_9MAGN
MWKIQARLKDELKNSNHFIRSMTSKMQLKFDKYWKDCNEILAICVILDPRYKTKVVDFVFSRIYGDEGKFKVAIIRDKLQLLFETYSHESHHSSGDVSTTSNQTPQFVEANDIREDDLYAMGFDFFQGDDVSNEQQSKWIFTCMSHCLIERII